MLTRLRALLPTIREDLRRSDGWHCREITYEHPHVLRLWRQYGDDRIFLHRLSPVPFGDEAMWHPHPWPSATLIVEGRYSMGVADSVTLLDRFAGVVDDLPGDQLAELELGPGSTYTMTNPDAWHVVQPIVTTYSIMLTGQPYEHPVKFPGPVSAGRDIPIESDEARAYMGDWAWMYDRATSTEPGSWSRHAGSES
jgi:hypothetical protein